MQGINIRYEQIPGDGREVYAIHVGDEEAAKPVDVLVTVGGIANDGDRWLLYPGPVNPDELKSASRAGSEAIFYQAVTKFAKLKAGAARLAMIYFAR